MLHLKELLEQFKGKSVAEIAEMVRSRGIKARTGTTSSCALAIMLNNVNTGSHIIGRKWIVRRSGKVIEKISTPANLATFIRKFDLGHYPEMLAVAPRCLPKPPKRKQIDTRKGHRHKQPHKRQVINHLAKLVGRFAP